MNRRKFTVTLVLLLVCLVLLVSVSYAWLSLTVAPEVSGIDTHIGANGSLEIALLSDETYLDPSGIRSMVGDSMVVQEAEFSNLTWGNVIDLSGSGYGLGNISLRPSRLNVTQADEGVFVSSSMLSYPQYGIDGRFGEFFSNTVSATFQNGKFLYSSEKQTYGVRGVGPVSGMTAQQAALATAKSLVQSYTSAAGRAAASVWNANGGGLMDILVRGYGQNADSFDSSDVALVRDTASRLYSMLGYIDLALRQGIVGYAASATANEADFRNLRAVLENTTVPLSMILDQLPANMLPGVADWITWVDAQKVAMQQVIRGCDRLSGEQVPWSALRPLIEQILDVQGLYIGDVRMDTDEAWQTARLIDGQTVTLASAAGVLSVVADYVGNYRQFFEYSQGITLEAVSVSNVRVPYLVQISQKLAELEAPSEEETTLQAPLQETYGYAVDVAVRCNASTSQLQLQTMPALRLEDEENMAELQGSGSYMRFSSEHLSNEQTVMLMDAIRIAFVDDQGKVLAVAKLNTSNYAVEAEGVMAYLYLYDYVVAADGSLTMGERRSEDTGIVELDQNTVKILTAIVWLDGDHVDNSLAGITAKSMTGTLNLQFSSSAQLLSSEGSIVGSE